MKPSWNDAPECAQWLAQDYVGTWFWYGDKPDMLDTCWDSPIEYASMMDMASPAIAVSTNWQSTLEKRPQTDTKG